MVKWRNKGVFWNKYVAWELNKSSGSVQAQDSWPKASILKTLVYSLKDTHCIG